MKRLVTAFVLLVAASIGAIAKACPVTVGRGAREPPYPDRTAGAADILDDDHLAERGAHLVGHDPRRDIGRAAGWERHDQRDRTGREIIGASGRKKCEKSKQKSKCDRTKIL